MDLPGLREGGKALCAMLRGVDKAGSYEAYAATKN